MIENRSAVHEKVQHDSITARAVRNLNQYLNTPEEQVLREHQFDAMGAIRDFLVSGEKDGYITLPPGSGKTVIFSQLARGTGLRTLVLSPTVKILSQANETFEMFAPDIAVSSYYGRKKDLSGDVVNTTYQSAIGLIESGLLDPKSFDLVIPDELHMSLGDQRHKIHRYFDHAIRLGLTATPSFDQLEAYEQRGLISRNEPWLGLFRNCIYEMGLEEAMERGINANADIIMFKTRTRVQDVEIASTGDYNKRDINRELNKETRNFLTIGMIAGVDRIPSHVRISADKKEEIEQIHDKIKGKRTAVFGLSVEQVNELAKLLQNLGVTAAAVHGYVSYEERDRIFAGHKNGDIQVILGVDMLRIGWDSPETKVGIYQAPTHSGTVALQEFGRILRPYEDQNATAIQFVDEFEERRNAPILISNLFDPEYVLRGSVFGLGLKKKGEKTRDKVHVTFSGMEIDSIIEEAKSNELLRTRFKRGSINEISEIIDRLIAETQEQNPELVGLPLYKEIQKAIPRIPRDKQREAFQGIASIDSNVAQKSKKAILFTSLSTIMSAVEPFIGRDNQENEEIIHAAIQGVLDRLSNLRTGTHIGSSIYGFAQDGVVDLLKDKDGIPPAWIIKSQYTRELGRLIAIFRNPKDLSPETVSELATLLINKFGVDEAQIQKYLKLYYDKIIAAKNPEGNFGQVSDAALRELVQDALATLKDPRERKVLELRFGLDDGEERTLKEVGQYFHVTRERPRQIEIRALRKLRHPSISRHLRDFMERDDSQNPIRYDSRDFINNRSVLDPRRVNIRYVDNTISPDVHICMSWTDWVKVNGLENLGENRVEWYRQWNDYEKYLSTLPKDKKYTFNPPVIRLGNEGLHNRIAEEAEAQGLDELFGPIARALLEALREQEQIIEEFERSKNNAPKALPEQILEKSRRGLFLDADVIDSYAEQIMTYKFEGEDISPRRAHRVVKILDDFIAAIDEHGENSVAHLPISPAGLVALIQLSKARPELDVMTISGLKNALDAMESGRVNFAIAGGNKRINKLRAAIAEFERTKSE